VDAEFIHDLFSEFGPVQVRRMFGGAGIFADGLMFALISGNAVYLKADAAGTAAFERERCAPFAYKTKTGQRTVMSYWRLPDRLYDEPEELARWAQQALAAARAGAKRVSKPKRKKRKARR
jgi:DNA transformation protein